MKFNIRVLLILLSQLINSLFIFADSIEVSGLVSGTWNADTVNVIGNIELRESETLIINPGVQIRFQGEFYFRVTGSLKAIGNSDYSILFTIADTIGFYNDTIPNGGWKQIRIENHSQSVDSVLFNYCRFEYGKAVDEDSVHGYGGALCIRNSDKVRISHCTFKNNYAYYSGGAVYLENSSVIISQNRVENNHCGQATVYYGYGGGICSDWSESRIERNYFTGNKSTGIGGGLCIRFKDCQVFHNIFDDNYSALGGGFGVLHIDTCNSVISNNLVINNGALFFGAGISNGDCSPTYVNNTIADNHCNGGGGGFYCKDSVVPVLYNNIIYGNTQYGGQINQVYLWDQLSQPNFYFNDIQGGIESFDGTGASDFFGEYQNNISQDPLFEINSYSPGIQSPCVNTASPDTNGLMIPAKDLAGNTRFVDINIDMGAYEQQVLLAINPNSSFGNFKLNKVWPNPSGSDIEIEFELPANDDVTIFVTDMNGKFVKEICHKYLETGFHQLTWKQQDQPVNSGIYIIILQTPKTSIHFNIVILRK